MIVEIDGILVAGEVLTARFSCDLAECRGQCCVEGNAGAPLEADEAGRLEADYARYRPWLTPAGVEAIRAQGFFTVDDDGDLTTPLVGGAECAYACVTNGVTGCAIEKAWHAGATDFRKPISCHLYPIRVAVFGDGSVGLNYHRWSVCEGARRLGERLGVPLYRALEAPIVRRFGRAFFEQLEAAAAAIEKEAPDLQERG